MGYSSWAGRPYGGINLNFSSSSMDTSYHSRKMDFDCTNGVICDKNGKLLFYSNGVYVANAIDSQMLNGNNLNPCQFTTDHQDGLTIPQANLIIPFPNDTTKYYLFHSTANDYPGTYCSLYLYYSVIDMTLDSGRGAVIQKNVILLQDSLVDGRITACKHANGRDWWLLAHQNHSDLYYKFLITPSGISSPISQNIGAYRDSHIGQCVFSPDGSMLAYYEPIVGDLDIFNFDRCTGDFSSKAHVDINDSAIGGGVAFSPNSQVLYVSSMNYVYQFDINAANIAASQTTVAVWDSFYSPNPPLATLFYLAQLAPDGKIYIVCSNGTLDIHVINNPDVLGLGCNLCQHCIHLPAFNGFTIANHPNYFLGWKIGSPCDSLPHLGIDEAPINSNLNLHPNPVASQEITFTYDVSLEHRMIIINNINGAVVAKYDLPQWSSVQHIKLPKLALGVYIARLISDHTVGNVKFVIE